MGSYKKKLGEYIREERNRRAYSVTKVAELSGVSRQHITKIENGEYKSPGSEKLSAIAKALNLNVEYVLTLAGYIDIPSSTDKSRTVRHIIVKLEKILLPLYFYLYKNVNVW